MRLLVVANRAPIRQTEEGWAPSVGGLSTALLPVLEERGGVWVAMGDEPGLPEHQPYPEADPRFDVRRVSLSEEEMERYYYGMANKVLWPVSHYLLQHLELERGFIDEYRAVNRRFAEAAAGAYEEGDHVWVQDYHLMLVPEHLRRALPEARIGLFWHIPWPAMEVFRILPWARELIRGMLGSDLIGFHVDEYVKNFVESAHVLLGVEVGDGYLRWQGREVRVKAFPIGIDVAGFEGLAGSEAVRRGAAVLRQEMNTDFLVIGVDRLDYTKGILERLLAYEQLLKERADLHGRITFYQVATPSRTEVESYQQLKREVDEAVGRINGAFGRDTWVPVRYRYRAYGQEELCILYRAADAALISPLRDGMNLVAQEFLAASERGVLILSELTGAAYLLTEALQVNPYDQPGVMRALVEALEMPEDERRQRLALLKEKVAGYDVHRWADSFLEAMA